MNRSRRPLLLFVTTLAFLLLAGAVVVAQVAAPATCPDLVMEALRTVNDLCQGQGRNSACYGNYLVEAQLAADQPLDVFDAPADIAALNLLTALKTAPLNEELSQWGVSILSVQANIPGALPGQSALFMLLGGAEIESAITPDQAFSAAEPALRVSAAADAALRERPAEDSPIARSVMPGDALLADARSGDYLRVTAGDQFGWIKSDQTSADATTVGALPAFTQGESFTPMQAFYLRTSIGEPLCAQAPSALVVQGPEGLHVDIQANGADINLGSTIILRTYTIEEAERAGLFLFGDFDVGGLLELSVIDGRATVRQEDGSPVFINEGEQAFICLDKPDDLGVDGRDNDQPITYACGGWTIPSRIPQELRDEFSLVDDYPLIYPVDIMTPTPTMPPTATRPGPVSTAISPPATSVTGQPNVGVNAVMTLSPDTGAALPVLAEGAAAQPLWVLDASLTLTNSGQAAAAGVSARGIMPRGGEVVARPSQGTYDAASDTWNVGTIPVGGQASLRLVGRMTAACGETVSGAIRVSWPGGAALSVPYTLTATCTPVPTGTATLVPSGTPSLTPTATDTLVPTATDTPEPPTATATPSNTPIPPTATLTPSNTPLPPTPTFTPVPRVSPVLECVRDNGGGSYTAFFGYNNTSGVAQSIPVGSANRFSPSPEDRGQPSAFQPGRQVSVFSVTWNGTNLVWVLNLSGQGGTATANANSARCAGQPPTATQTPSNTPVPPTATQTPSNTPEPPTATPTATLMPSETPTDDPDGPKMTICHNGHTSITIPIHTVYQVHLYEDNTPRPGNEGTYIGPCVN